MEKITLGEIYILPALLNSSALEINQRLFAKCKQRHELISILELVTPLKVLAYKNCMLRLIPITHFGPIRSPISV